MTKDTANLVANVLKDHGENALWHIAEEYLGLKEDYRILENIHSGYETRYEDLLKAAQMLCLEVDKDPQSVSGIFIRKYLEELAIQCGCTHVNWWG